MHGGGGVCGGGGLMHETGSSWRESTFFVSVFFGIFYLLISLSDAVFPILSSHMLVFFSLSLF